MLYDTKALSNYHDWTYRFVGQMLHMAGKAYFFTKDTGDIGWKLRIYEGSFLLAL